MSGKPKKRLRKRKARGRQEVAAGTLRARRRSDKPRLAMATIDAWRRCRKWTLMEEDLRMALEVAVPFRIEEVRRWPRDVVKVRAEECSHLIGEGGDALMFGSQKRRKKKRQKDIPGLPPDVPRDLSAGNVFNALVDSCAIGALQPGGIRLFGLHFEAKP